MITCGGGGGGVQRTEEGKIINAELGTLTNHTQKKHKKTDCSGATPTCWANACIAGTITYAYLGFASNPAGVYAHPVLNGLVAQSAGSVAANTYDSGTSMAFISAMGRSRDGSALFAAIGSPPTTIIGCSVNAGAVTGCARTASSFSFSSISGFAFTVSGANAYIMTQSAIVGCGERVDASVACPRARR